MTGIPNGPDTPPRTHADAPDWLVRQRIAVPAPPARHCQRPELVRRCAPLRQAATLLMAPGGFGKTTLLADCCREAAAAGVPVAWLTLADDDPAALDTYLAFAFREARVDAVALDAGTGSPVPAHPRTAAVFGALAVRSEPCVLALDELECVTHPGSVALLNHVLRNAPPSLHLALAYRTLPRGLDVVAALIALGAKIVTARDLRFSRADIARFFDLALSRSELAAVDTESRGWPIALQMRRNAPARIVDDETLAVRDAVGAWLDGRFWRGFAAADRERVLDLALFDRVDSGLLEEVLEEPNALARVAALPGLAGLLVPGRGAESGVYRLHPLLREHCADRRRRERPGRYREVHRRIARALAGRGATVEAMRHAAEAGDGHLAGTVLLDAGGLQWWLREGWDRLAAAGRYLTDEAIAAQPRLALVPCMNLLSAGRVADANRAFDAVPAAPDDPAFGLDRLLTLAFLGLNGSRTIAEVDAPAIAAEAARIAALPTTRQVARGTLLFGLAAYRAAVADFHAGAALASQARRLLVGQSTFMTLVADSLRGQIAAARGRVREAARHYRSAQRTADERFLEDPRMGTLVGALTSELALERNRLGDDIDPPRMARAVYRAAGLLVHTAAASGVAVEHAAATDGTDAALGVVDDLQERANDGGWAVLGRLLAAMRVSLLADAGRVGDAQRAWRAAALPEDDAGCLDFAGRGWRDAEALGCARVRLLAASGDGAAAAKLERTLAVRATESGLLRTLMRSLALRVRLRHGAGDPDGAAAAALEYLRQFLHADYARPLLNAGGAATAALQRILDAGPERPIAAAAGRILAMGTGTAPATVPSLDGREMAVLRLLGTHQDKEIARVLGLSRHGVRYHLRKIFRKLGVGRRHDAARRAQALGILPPDA